MTIWPMQPMRNGIYAGQPRIDDGPGWASVRMPIFDPAVLSMHPLRARMSQKKDFDIAARRMG